MKTRITISALLLILCMEGMNAFGWTGSGTYLDPYQIATAADLATLATNCNAGNTYLYFEFKMMNDISLAGYAWVPIGNDVAYGFQGTFNGNNKTISGLSCSGYTDSGLFGTLGGGSRILNLTISGCNVSGNYRAGSLAGLIDTDVLPVSIINCHSSGTITSIDIAGGLIGMANNPNASNSGCIIKIKYCSSSATVGGTSLSGGIIGQVEGYSSYPIVIRTFITNCYTSGLVNGGGGSGGIVGFMTHCNVENCYSRSTISAPEGGMYVGGLAGETYEGMITKSFSAGLVSPGTGRGFIGENLNGSTSVTDCYWDTQTSGQSSSNGGGTGKTTAEMKNPATFTNYDFVQDWAMSDTVNNGYPYLSTLFNWIGLISTDWNSPENWDLRAVPSPGASVTNGAGYNFPSVVIGQGTSSPIRLVNLLVYSTSLNNVIITPGSALTVQGRTTLNGGEKLVIESEGSFIDNGITGTGTVKVKHDLSGNRWWYIGSPMTNATAGSFGTLSPTPNSGTRLFCWNEPTNAYVNITDGSAVLAPLTGYSYKNFTGANIATFTGALNSGWVGSDNNLSFTSGGANAGYNLVCNPFPSAINWGSPAHPATGITRTGIDSTIWYRTNSTYSTYNATSGTGTGSPVGQPYIPAMQAFWVHVSDAATGHGTLRIGNGARVHNSQPFYKSTGEQNIFRLFVSRDTLKDDIAVGFYEQALPGFDPYDSEKRFNDAAYPHLFTFTSDNHVVVINGQPVLQNQDSLTIPLGFGTAVEGVFTMEATNMNDFDPGLSVYLLDKQGGFRQDLRENNSFTFQSDVAGPDAARFSLYFSKKGSGETELTDQPAVHIYSAGSMLYIDVLAGGPAKAELYNLLGQKVLGRQVEHGLNQIEVNCLSGVYIARVLMGDKIVMKKIILWK